jgi:hypothetical protein
VATGSIPTSGQTLIVGPEATMEPFLCQRALNGNFLVESSLRRASTIANAVESFFLLTISEFHVLMIF